ncbi:UNVERIFIED_ORG: hypothetical protein J2W85_007036 [Ensifer adhaerens]|nr:hypothetical protein [Ensifer adhaerens]
MIDPPNQPPGTLERKVELEQTVDYAVEVLVEEACLLGWTRAEFLTAISDAASARLSALEEEVEFTPDGGEFSRTTYPTD